MSTNSSHSAAMGNLAQSDLVYFNGIDLDTGNYAVEPTTIADMVRRVSVEPGVEAVVDLQGETLRAFAAPFGIDQTNLADVGWAIVFPEDASKELRDALVPLMEYRRKQAGNLFQVLDYKKGEQVRDWYGRHNIAAGTFEATSVPFYLLLVGPPTAIPFEFQYLLGIEYAVGRLAFDNADDYHQYAASTVAYETDANATNLKEIVYWGTRHAGDVATNLSASHLIDPLCKGIPGAAGAAKVPVSERVGYRQQLFADDAATRDALLNTLHATHPPAMLFTASHGMSIRPDRPNQRTDSGALLCQNWPGFGNMNRECYLAAEDVHNEANIRGLIAFHFACFSGGTPDIDHFPTDLSQVGKAPLLTPEPFVAALPRRLLSHPNGSALAVICHIDRAWTFSIQPAKSIDAQVGPFRESLCFILSGCPVGLALTQQFGQRFSALSAWLLSAISPTAPANLRPNDRDLVSFWLERNDAQNYVVLGDPAVRIRDNLSS